MDECVPKRDYVAGRDWPLKGTPKIEWIFALESRRGQKFTQTLRLAETIRLDSGEKPNVLLVGAGEIEPLEYGLAGFYVTAYEMDKTLAQNALQLVEDAGISDSVNVISDQLTPANFPDNNRLVVFDRSLHYHTESEAKSLLLKAMEGLAPGGYLKLRIFLKGSEIFTRPYNNFFYDNKWAPTYHEVISLFPVTAWDIMSTSGVQDKESPINISGNSTNYSTSILLRKKRN